MNVSSTSWDFTYAWVRTLKKNTFALFCFRNQLPFYSTFCYRHVGRATLTNSYDGRSSRPGTGHSSSCTQHHFHGHRHPRHSVNAASQTAKSASTAAATSVPKHPKLEFQSSSVNMIEAGNSKIRWEELFYRQNKENPSVPLIQKACYEFWIVL